MSALTRRTLLGSMAALPLVGCRSTAGTARAGTPRDAGFRLPAEWSPHEALITAFPTAATGLRAEVLARYRAEWQQVAAAAAAFEPLIVVAHPDEASAARAAAPSGTEVVAQPINDIWLRDTGPLVLVHHTSGERAAANFAFNGWGEKFPHADDAALKAALCDHLGLDRWTFDMVLEGGAISQDGAGRALTTERCLLHPDRGGLTKAQVERVLSDALAIDEVIWLPDGLVPDPITDGHVDGIAQFIAPGVVACHTIDDPSDPNTAICAAAVEILEAAGITVVAVPLDSFTVSHVNFALVNGACLVPVAGSDWEDERPLAALAAAMPDREIVPIVATELAALGGGVHCITQQLPRPT